MTLNINSSEHIENSLRTAGEFPPVAFSSLDSIDICSILFRRAMSSPDAIAFRFLINGDDEIVDWTYSQVDFYANCIAKELAKKIQVGAKVLLVLEPGLHYIAALFGIFKAGATAVPSFPPSGTRAVSRLASIYADCKAELIIADANLHNSLTRLNASLVSGENRPEWLLIGDDYFDEKNADTQYSIDEKSVYAYDIAGAEKIRSNTPALLQYTSGSTGDPKGVMLSHANLISNSRVLDIRLGTLDKHIGFSWLPPYHDMGLMGALLLSVYSGFPLVVMSPAHFIQRPLRWLKGISRYKVTTSVAPNFALDLCVDTISDEELAELDLSNLTMLFCGAEPVRQSTLDRFSEKFKSTGFSKSAFVPCYGLAEATLFISGKPDQNAEPKFLTLNKTSLSLGIAQLASNDISDQSTAVISCGTVATDHALAIVDPDTLKRLPSGIVGEIWFKGASVAQGYFNQSISNAAVFNAVIEDEPSDGLYLRTGDLGFVLDDELYITGRIKDVIIFAGRNLYPQDIESSAQSSHSAIRTNGVAAFSINSDHAEQLIVVAEIMRSAKLTSEDLKNVEEAISTAIIRSHGVNPFAVHLTPVSTIPLTTSGKIRRSACREAYINGALANARPHVAKPVVAEFLKEE